MWSRLRSKGSGDGARRCSLPIESCNPIDSISWGDLLSWPRGRLLSSRSCASRIVCGTIAIKYRWLEGRTERHAIDGLNALNFVAHGGGASRSLCLDNSARRCQRRFSVSSWIFPTISAVICAALPELPTACLIEAPAAFGHELLVAFGVLTISPMKQISPVVAAMPPFSQF